MELHNISISKISGVSNARLACFNKLGIFSVLDILYFFPKSYENRGELTSIISLQADREASVKAVVIDVKHRVIRSKLCVTSVLVADNSSELKITFFNKKFVIKQLEIGKEYLFFGKVTKKYGLPEMSQPEFEKAETGSFCDGLTPRYHLTKGITQNIMMSVMKKALDFADYVFICSAHKEYIDEARAITSAENIKGVFDASNIYNRNQFINNPEKYAGIGKGIEEPTEDFVDFVYESFRAMEKGLGHELLGLINFYNEDYAFDEYNKVKFKDVQRLAKTCSTGCEIADPDPIERVPEYKGFSSVLAQKGFKGSKKSVEILS